MQILYYENGEILAIGQIANDSEVYHVTNDIDDISDYYLQNFTKTVFCDTLEVEIPAGFKKFEYKFIDSQLVKM